MLSLLLAGVFSANWAVLMAGSRGYNNYRHQADVFNIYDLLTTRGFDPSHIITLAYDDVVNHNLNPFKGQVFATLDHRNVYPGADRIDYREDQATAENFVRVLVGDTKKGRALASTKDDDVFVYYNDHGAPGLLCVPSNNGPEIYADQIRKTFQEMKEKQMFKRLFFVIEACYSGSVAGNITVDNVFSITAAGPTQSSYSADWDPSVDAFLTNEFTKHFVQFVESHPDQSIVNCLNHVSESTLRSHVTAYGDFKVAQAPLSAFLLSGPPRRQRPSLIPTQEPESNGIPTKFAFIEFLKRRIAKSSGVEREQLERALAQEQTRRRRAATTFKGIVKHFMPNGGDVPMLPLSGVDYSCYRTCVEGYRLFCGEVDEYELPKLRIFGHLCGISNTSQILTQIREVCPQQWWRGEDLYI